MTTTLDLIRAAIGATAAVSPRLAGALALRAFFSANPRQPVRPSDASALARAERSAVEVRGRTLPVCTWGADGPLVLLAHGWRGRAAQFAPLALALEAAGMRAVAFDAPAHGDAPGGPVDVRDWVAALDRLSRDHGGAHAVVGHSFGAFAALTAVRRGLGAGAVVAIAGAGAPDAFVREFARMMRLDPRVSAELMARFLTRVDETPTTIGPRYDAIAYPLEPHVRLLLAHGTADPQIDPEESRLLHAAHPASELLLLDGIGHNRILAEARLVGDVVRFLGGAVSALAGGVALEELVHLGEVDAREGAARHRGEQ